MPEGTILARRARYCRHPAGIGCAAQQITRGISPAANELGQAGAALPRLLMSSSGQSTRTTHLALAPMADERGYSQVFNGVTANPA